MSGVIPKEKLKHFQRWDVGSFNSAKVPTSGIKPEPAKAPQNSGKSAPAAPPPQAAVVNEPAAPAPPQPSPEELERIYEEARASGYEAGLVEGRTKGEQATQKAAREQAQRLDTLLANLRTALQEMDQTVADTLLEFGLELTAQLMRGAIQGKKDVLLPLIREAIDALPLHHAHIMLQLHPDDADNVRTLIGEQLAQNNVQIAENPEIKRGGCVLKAGASEIDASNEMRWKRVLEAIGLEPEAWLTNE